MFLNNNEQLEKSTVGSFSLLKKRFDEQEKNKLDDILATLRKHTNEKDFVKLHEIVDEETFKKKTYEFCCLIKTYRGVIRWHIKNVYGSVNGPEADDAYQDVMLRLWKEFPSYEFRSEYKDSFLVWAKLRIKGALINNLRRLDRWQSRVDLMEDPEQMFKNLKAEYLDAEDEEQLKLSILQGAIASLPSRYQQVINLQLAGLSTAEMSIKLSLPEETVTYRIKKARRVIFASVLKFDPSKARRLAAENESKVKSRQPVIERLIQFRGKFNLSAKKFARICNIDESTYLKLERGVKPLGNVYLKKICTAFRLSEFDVLHGDKMPEEDIVRLYDDSNKEQLLEQKIKQQAHDDLYRERVIALREQLQMTKQKFWANINVDRSHGSKFEKGSRRITEFQRERIEWYYKVKLSSEQNEDVIQQPSIPPPACLTSESAEQFPSYDQE
jgi:RNA polymerase sigma factor (sigma-70 family)